MTFKKLLIAAIATVALSGSASAAVLTSWTGAPGNQVTDYSAPSLVAFDIDLHTLAGTRFNFILEEADLLGPLSMNALVRNLSGEGMTEFAFMLDGITFAGAGSVTPTFGTVDKVVASSSAALINFGKPEFAEFHFGNPFAAAGKLDWRLDTTGMRAGDRFVITATVPEPSTLVLLLSALALFSMYGAKGRDKH